MKRMLTTCVGLGFALTLAACADEQPLTWEEFRAQAYQSPDGTYVVNGDELAEDSDELYEYYNDYLDSVEFDGIGRLQQGLAVNRFEGHDDRALFPLEYCILTDGGHPSAIRQALSQAAQAWQSAAGVQFREARQFSGHLCSNQTRQVDFNVREVFGQPFRARAFFPHDHRLTHELLIDGKAFADISPLTLTGILRHELGHVLGFRHEHTRPEAGVCFEDNNWRALTTYDSNSVMHYAECNGTNTGDYVLTARDKAGAAALYPPF